MANLKNINLMSQDTFESIEQADDELYAVSGSGIGFPSSRYDDLTLGASGTEYTAPANGWFMYAGSINTAGRIEMASTAQRDSRYAASGVWTNAVLQIRKGQKMKLHYDGVFSINLFRFVYAEGE
jgi:hypothetical protein